MSCLLRYMPARRSTTAVERTFLLFLIVTLETPGTGFIPSFCMAFLLFFSDLLCFPREGVPSSAHHRVSFHSHSSA